MSMLCVCVCVCVCVCMCMCVCVCVCVCVCGVHRICTLKSANTACSSLLLLLLLFFFIPERTLIANTACSSHTSSSSSSSSSEFSLSVSKHQHPRRRATIRGIPPTSITTCRPAKKTPRSSKLTMLGCREVGIVNLLYRKSLYRELFGQGHEP